MPSSRREPGAPAFPRSAKRIPAIDGLRALAVGMVMLYHFGSEWVPGGHGVLISFVLSGFLITWLLLEEQERAGAISVWGFYRRRALRLLPGFYAFLALALVLVTLVRHPIHWAHVRSVVFYYANYFNALHGEDERNLVVSHLWSLTLQEQFYVLWPLLLLCLARNVRRLVAFLVVAIAAVWTWRAARELTGTGFQYLYYASESRADAILVGCLTAVAVRHGLMERVWRALTASAWLPLLTLGAFTVSAFYSATSSPYSHTVGWSLEALLVAVAIVQLATLSGRRAWSWLDHRALRWTGGISYSLYLYQQIGMSPNILPGRPAALRLVACTALTFLLAAGSHYLVERPFLRQRGRAARPAPAEAVSVVPRPAVEGEQCAGLRPKGEPAAG